ncbi:MAG: hypothetical protein K2Q14_06875 [Gammaproteobacteria bacterium]|nr:hypothetical protein [Gammaproteobacteria bacterium]
MISQKKVEGASQGINYLGEGMQDFQKQDDKYLNEINMFCREYFYLGEPFNVDETLHNCGIKNYNPNTGPYNLCTLIKENQEYIISLTDRYYTIYFRYFQKARTAHQTTSELLSLHYETFRQHQQRMSNYTLNLWLDNGWHTFLEIANWWTIPAWWRELQDENGRSYQVDNSIREYGISQARYVAYSPAILEEALELLLKFNDFIDYAIEEVTYNKNGTLNEEIERRIYSVIKAVYTKIRGKSESEENTILAGKEKFFESYLSYLTLFRKTLKLHFKGVLQTLFQWLCLAETHGFNNQSLMLNMLNRICQNHTIKSNGINLKILYDDLNGECKRYFNPGAEGLSLELYIKFIFYILKHGDDSLKKGLEDFLKYFNPQKDNQGFRLKFVIVKNSDLIIPRHEGLDELISTLQISLCEIKPYQPKLSSICEYQSLKKILVNSLEHGDVKDKANLLDEMAILLDVLCFNWLTYEEHSIAAREKNKDIEKILQVWRNAFQQEIIQLIDHNRFLDPIVALLSGKKEKKEKVKIIYSSQDIIRLFITNSWRLITAWKNLKPPIEEQVTEAFHLLQKIKTNLVEIIMEGLICRNIEDDTITLLINLAGFCQTGALDSQYSLLTLLNIEDNANKEQISIENIRQNLAQLVPDNIENILWAAMCYIASTIPKRCIVPLLEKGDEYFKANIKLISLWEKTHGPLIEDYKNRLPGIFQGQNADGMVNTILLYLRRIVEFYGFENYKENLVIPESFWTNKAENNLWHEVVIRLPFKERQTQYFMERVEYLLQHSEESISYLELEQIKEWQASVQSKLLSDRVEKALKSTALLWTFSDLWLQLLDVNAQERCNEHWDTYFFARIKNSLQDVSQVSESHTNVINDLNIIHTYFPVTIAHKIKLADLAQQLYQKPWNEKNHAMMESCFSPFDKHRYRYHWLENFLHRDQHDTVLQKQFEHHKKELVKATGESGSLLNGLSIFFGEQYSSYNENYALYVIKDVPLTTEVLEKQNIAGSAIIVARVIPDRNAVVIIFIENGQPLQIAENYFLEFKVNLSLECFEFIMRQKNSHCIKRKDLETEPYRLTLYEIIETCLQQAGLPHVLNLIQTWLNKPMYHPIAWNLLAYYFNNDFSFKSSLPLSEEEKKFKEVKKEYEAVNSWYKSGMELKELFNQGEFKNLSNRIISHAMDIGNNRNLERFEAYLLIPLTEHIKLLLADAKNKDMLNSGSFTQSLNKLIKKLEEMLPPIICQQSSVQDLQFVLSSTIEIISCHLELIELLKLDSQKCLINWNELKLKAVLKGFPEKNLQDIYKKLSGMNTADMSQEARTFWSLFCQYLEAPPIKRQQVESLVNDLTKILQSKSHPIDEIRAHRIERWQNTLSLLFTPFSISKKGYKPNRVVWRENNRAAKMWNIDIVMQIYREEDDTLNFNSPKINVNHKVKKINIPNRAGTEPTFSSIYIKVSPDSPGAALQWATFSRYFDPNLPQVEVIKMQYIDDQSRLSRHPVLLSETVEGETLHNVMEKKGFMFKLNQEAFSRQFMLALLLRPADQKPENIIVRRCYKKEDVEEYELIPIDNDQFGVPPFYTEMKLRPMTSPSSAEGATYPLQEPAMIHSAKLGIKTVLFCMDEMNKPIHKEIKEYLLALNIEELLDVFLKETKRINSKLFKIFTEEERNELYNLEKPVELLAQMENTFFPTLYDNLLRVQDYIKLHQYQKITHMDLLKEIYPPLAAHYETGLIKNIPLSERFKDICGKEYQMTKEAIPCSFNLQFAAENEVFNFQTMLESAAYIKISKKNDLLEYTLKKSDGRFEHGKIRKDELSIDVWNSLLTHPNTDEVKNEINEIFYRKHGYTVVNYGYTTSHFIKEIIDARSRDSVDVKTWRERPRVSMKYAEENWKSIRNLRKKMSETKRKLLEGKKEQFTQLSIPALKEAVINSIKFDELTWAVTDKDSGFVFLEGYDQEFILEAIKGVPFQSLNLSHCTALKWEQLLEILKNSRFLKKLNVSYCSSLKLYANEMFEIANLCPWLIELNMVGIGSLEYIGYYSMYRGKTEITWPWLQRLNISKNNDLWQIYINAPHLISLRASDCAVLSTISVSNAKLKHLDIRNSPIQNLKNGESLLSTLSYLSVNESLDYYPFKNKTSLLLLQKKLEEIISRRQSLRQSESFPDLSFKLKVDDNCNNTSLWNKTLSRKNQLSFSADQLFWPKPDSSEKCLDAMRAPNWQQQVGNNVSMLQKESKFLKGTSSKVPNFWEKSVKDEIPQEILEESFAANQVNGLIGPRGIEGFALQDVDDKGNCFYEAIVDQMRLTGHVFIKETPEGTALHDRLRVLIQEKAFCDREWAGDEEFFKLVRKLDVVLGVIDTRYPEAGYTYYYQNDQNEVHTERVESPRLPEKPIFKIAATGNHFLSVRSEPVVEEKKRALRVFAWIE